MTSYLIGIDGMPMNYQVHELTSVYYKYPCKWKVIRKLGTGRKAKMEEERTKNYLVSILS